MSGIASSVDLSGGGIVSIKYSNIQLRNATGQSLRYWSNLASRHNGGQRGILVPLLTDFYAPLATGVAPVQFVRHSDGSPFSDGSGYGQPSISAIAVGAAAVNAAAMTIKIITGGTLNGGEWFEIAHPTKLNRVYNVTDILSFAPNADGSVNYSVLIRPTLREAITAGVTVNFYRPKCYMRIAPGSAISADIEKFWYATPEVTFIEKFGTG